MEIPRGVILKECEKESLTNLILIVEIRRYGEFWNWFARLKQLCLYKEVGKDKINPNPLFFICSVSVPSRAHRGPGIPSVSWRKFSGIMYSWDYQCSDNSLWDIYKVFALAPPLLEPLIGQGAANMTVTN